MSVFQRHTARVSEELSTMPSAVIFSGVAADIICNENCAGTHSEINNRTNVTLDTNFQLSADSRNDNDVLRWYNTSFQRCTNTMVTNKFSTLAVNISKILIIYFYYWIHVLRVKTYFKEDYQCGINFVQTLIRYSVNYQSQLVITFFTVGIRLGQLCRQSVIISAWASLRVVQTLSEGTRIRQR